MSRKIGATGLVQHSDKFNGMYRGTVMDNVDPDQLGKVKIKIYPMLSGVETENLPWAIPAMPLSVGAGSGYGNFWVPDIGNNVWVFFEYGDIYQPVYFAEATDGVKGLPGNRVESYPDTSVFETKTGIQIKINRKAGEEDIRINHPSGASVEIMPDGNIQVMTVQTGANIYIMAGEGDITLESLNNQVNLIAAGSVNIGAPETVVTGSLRVSNYPTGTITDNTGKEFQVDNGLITKITR